MASWVYLLCAITSFAAAALQFRAYLAGRTRFLLWTSICFMSIFVNNLLLCIDGLSGPEVILALPRTVILLSGLGVLLYGFIWEMS